MSEIQCSILNAGLCRVGGFFFDPGSGYKTVNVPALLALLHHPVHGVVLFDTGYSTRFLTATEKLPYRIYRWLTPVKIEEKSTAVEQLRARSISPDDVKWIILSHFDPDHYGGLSDFPRARIVCSEQAWRAVEGKTGLSAFRQRILPGHLPADLRERLRLVTLYEDRPVGPFSVSHDLFGDGSVLLIPLPGHAPGQIGAFLNCLEGQQIMLVADACWTRASLRGRFVGMHRWIAHDRKSQDKIYILLKELQERYPEIRIVPSHCPEAAHEMVPDMKYDD